MTLDEALKRISDLETEVKQVSAEATKGIATMSLKYQKPVSFGLLTTDTIEQAIERAGTKAGNKGFEAMTVVIEMLDLYEAIGNN